MKNFTWPYLAENQVKSNWYFRYQNRISKEYLERTKQFLITRIKNVIVTL